MPSSSRPTCRASRACLRAARSRCLRRDSDKLVICRDATLRASLLACRASRACRCAARSRCLRRDRCRGDSAALTASPCRASSARPCGARRQPGWRRGAPGGLRRRRRAIGRLERCFGRDALGRRAGAHRAVLAGRDALPRAVTSARPAVYVTTRAAVRGVYGAKVTQYVRCR